MRLTCLRHHACGTRMIIPLSNLYKITCPRCLSAFEYSSWVCKPLLCPFVAKDDLACSIVIRPTRGTFLQYKVGEDLHIGISDALSVVHSYWLSGICSENTTWDNSVIICRFGTNRHKLNQALFSFLSRNSTRFLSEFYSDSEWNCFDFVMEFLRFINFRQYTKTDFVAEFVQGILSATVKYSRLVNRVNENGFILL